MKINGNIVSCAENFALRARCKLRGELRSMYGTVSLRVLIEMEKSIPPHYPLPITHYPLQIDKAHYPLKIDFRDLHIDTRRRFYI